MRVKNACIALSIVEKGKREREREREREGEGKEGGERKRDCARRSIAVQHIFALQRFGTVCAFGFPLIQISISRFNRSQSIRCAASRLASETATFSHGEI